MHCFICIYWDFIYVLVFAFLTGEDLLAIAADQPFRFPATFTFVVRAFSGIQLLFRILRCPSLLILISQSQAFLQCWMVLERGLILDLTSLRLLNRKFILQFLGQTLKNIASFLRLNEFHIQCSYALELLRFREVGVEVILKAKFSRP